MMTDLTPIINIIIALLGALVTAFVIPWLSGNEQAACFLPSDRSALEE